MRVRPFLAGLSELDPVLEDLIRASTAVDKGDLQAIATRVGLTLSTLRSSARGAGLRWCVQHGEHRLMQDGIRAPLAADELARIDRTLPQAHALQPARAAPAAGRAAATCRWSSRSSIPRAGPVTRWTRTRPRSPSTTSASSYSRSGRRPGSPGPHHGSSGRAPAVARTHHRLTQALGAAPVGVADAVPDESRLVQRAGELAARLARHRVLDPEVVEHADDGAAEILAAVAVVVGDRGDQLVEPALDVAVVERRERAAQLRVVRRGGCGRRGRRRRTSRRRCSAARVPPRRRRARAAAGRGRATRRRGRGRARARAGATPRRRPRPARRPPTAPARRRSARPAAAAARPRTPRRPGRP